MTDVHLPPDLDAFTAACVASRRFPDRDAVHRAALELLKVQESRRAAFAAMLQAAARRARQTACRGRRCPGRPRCADRGGRRWPVSRPAQLAPPAQQDLRQAIIRIAAEQPAAAKRLRDATGTALRRLVPTRSSARRARPWPRRTTASWRCAAFPRDGLHRRHHATARAAGAAHGTGYCRPPGPGRSLTGG